jgi:hypothetical protein
VLEPADAEPVAPTEPEPVAPYEPLEVDGCEALLLLLEGVLLLIVELPVPCVEPVLLDVE